MRKSIGIFVSIIVIFDQSDLLFIFNFIQIYIIFRSDFVGVRRRMNLAVETSMDTTIA